MADRALGLGQPVSRAPVPLGLELGDELGVAARADRLRDSVASAPVRDRSRRPTKKGGEWLALKLSDRSGSVSAKSWAGQTG